jgi:hypothetical protein
LCTTTTTLQNSWQPSLPISTPDYGRAAGKLTRAPRAVVLGRIQVPSSCALGAAFSLTRLPARSEKEEKENGVEGGNATLYSLP